MTASPGSPVAAAEAAAEKLGATCVRDIARATAFAVPSMDTGQRTTWRARLHGLLVFDCRLLNDVKTHRPWLKYKGIRHDTQCRHLYVSHAFRDRHDFLFNILESAVGNSKWKLYVPSPPVKFELISLLNYTQLNT